MLKKSLLIILIASAHLTAFAQQPNPNALLRDGMALSGVDGKLIIPDTNGTYYLRLDNNLRDDKAVITGGTNVELLLSISLEKMADNIKQDPETGFRVWGRVTTYKRKNYFFIDNYLPVGQIRKIENKPSQKPQKTQASKPDDELQLPAHVLEKLTAEKAIRPAQIQTGLNFEQNYALADRTGFILKQPDGRAVFVLDALGRNRENISIPLLPCRTLEIACQKQSAELEQIRFKVAGTVTKYKGSYYLLLQRARRAYSYGNFGR
jgi:hypothetical protein